jgi:hypothetical protein
MEFFETVSKGLLLGGLEGRLCFSGSVELLKEGVAEHKAFSCLSLLPFKHFQVGESDGPRNKGPARIVLLPLFPEGDGYLLQNFCSPVGARKHGRDVGGHLRLVHGPQTHKFSGAFHRRERKGGEGGNKVRVFLVSAGKGPIRKKFARFFLFLRKRGWWRGEGLTESPFSREGAMMAMGEARSEPSRIPNGGR